MTNTNTAIGAAALNYSTLHEYAGKYHLPYNELCAVVRAALASAAAPAEQPDTTYAGMPDDRESFKAYLKECDECAIVPDVAGAFNAAWQIASRGQAPAQAAPAVVAWPSEMHEAMCPALTGGRCTCERNDPTVDKAWAQFCGGIGDGPDAPYPGMISAFERYYSQSFIDKDWRNEASVWAAAWKQALLTAAAPPTQPAPQADSQPAPAVGTIAHVGTGKTTLTGAIASALRAAPVEQPDTARAALPAECDSPELCAVSRSCAGQFGTKRICASRGQAPAGAASVTDAMVLAALQVQYPAGYDTQLRHPANGPKTSARTEAEIDLARRMIAAALATNSAPAPQKQGGQRD